MLTAEEEIKDPLVLEFLDLKDEYSESDLESALVHHLENFLLSLAMTFRSSPGNTGSGSVTNGIEWTCSSFTGGCVVWS